MARTEFMHVRLTDEEDRLVRMLARAQGVSRSELVRRLIRDRVNMLSSRQQPQEVAS